MTEARFASTIKRLTKQLRAARPAPRDQNIVVATPRGAAVLPVREIDWIEAADNYARIWIGARSYLLREPLGQIERRVREHGFVRAHRRALVRLGVVRELSSSRAGALVVVLDCGTKIPISRRRRAAFTAAVRAQR